MSTKFYVLLAAVFGFSLGASSFIVPHAAASFALLGQTAGASGNRAVVDATSFAGSDAGAKIAAAVATLPPSGGVVDARGFSGAQTVSTDPFSSSPTPAVVLLGSATFNTSVQWRPHTSQRIVGLSSGTHSSYPSGSTIIRPTPGFAPASVIRIDPLNDSPSGLFIGDAGIEGITIDMRNVTAARKIAIELRSVVDTGPFRDITILNQDSGNYLFIGRSTSPKGMISEGLTFYDFFALSLSIDPQNADPGVIIEESNELAFLGARTKFMRRSNGSGAFAPNSVGVLIRTTAGQPVPVNAVTLDGISVAGYETEIKIASSNNALRPRWCRILNSTFETYRYGVVIDGDKMASPQLNLIGPGNRFISPSGREPRNILLDHAANNTVIADEYATAGAKVAELMENSQANSVWTSPGSAVDSGRDNLVFGRGPVGGSLKLLRGPGVN